MKRLSPRVLVLLPLLLWAAVGGFVSLPLAAQQRPVHVNGQALPASATSPSVIEGGTTNTTIWVEYLVIANTDVSAHTVSVVDCTSGTPFALFTNATIAASSTWFLPMGGIRFTGCFKWSANSTTVYGSLVGRRN